MLNTNASPHTWPAEWAPQSSTWLAWPHNRETWPDQFDKVSSAFVKLVQELGRVQSVHVLAGPFDVQPAARDVLSADPQLTIHDIKTNDAWIRDFGPTFVNRKDDSSLVGVTWKYNGWGAKYPPFGDDAKAAQLICRSIQCPQSRSTMYCEGGSLDGNGDGIVMTTSSCLLSVSRNPGWTRPMVETELRLQLGASKIIWLDGGGLEGDDTDGHIDQLARFVSRDAIVVATSSDPSDPNRDGLERNADILEQSTNGNGSQFQVHRLPTPPPRYAGERRIPESYCNFLFANGIVIMPTFRCDKTDQNAIDTLQSLLPNRTIIPLDAHEFSIGLGAFHCASQQQPVAQSL